MMTLRKGKLRLELITLQNREVLELAKIVEARCPNKVLVACKTKESSVWETISRNHVEDLDKEEFRGDLNLGQSNAINFKILN